MNHVQKATGSKKYIDVDIDASRNVAKQMGEAIGAEMRHQGVSGLAIETQGGYHIMVERDTMHKGFELYKMIQDFNTEAVELGGEVCFNTNAMVPLPGTFQAGHLVTFKVI